MANNWYVDSAATGTNVGTSWTNAAICLQQLLGIKAAASWTTSSTTITMSQDNPGWVTAGMTVYDATSGKAVGTVSSWPTTSTTLTLTGNASNASSGAADNLLFGGPTSVPVAGDSFFFHNTSAETYGVGTTLTLPGSISSPNYLYSTDTINTPPLESDQLAGASISMSAGGNLDLSGAFCCWGMTFQVGFGSTAYTLNLGYASGSTQLYDTCSFVLSGSGASVISACNNSGIAVWNNCTVTFSASVQSINISYGILNWKNTPSAILGSTFPTNLLFNNQGGSFSLEGVDLSALGSGNTISRLATAGSVNYLKDCKISSSVALSSIIVPGPRLYVSRTDSANSDNVFQLYDYAGTETNNTGVYRSGGAEDFNGNPFSKRIITTANAKVTPLPFTTLPMSMLNTRVGSTRTVTVYGYVAGSGSPPNNTDIWLEVEYPGSNASPLGSFINSATGNGNPPNPLTTVSALSVDSVSTWNGISGGTAFSMQVQLTAEIAGPLTVRVVAAKASTTYYIDALPVFS
jgi:hypothetical protein